MLSYIKLSAKRSKAVNQLVLNREETRVLVSLAAEPKPAGDIAPDVLSTLFSYNLAVELMGHCRITPRGQLELHRQRFRKIPGRKVARVTPSSFLFLQEAAFAHNAPTRAKLREFVSRRRQANRLKFFNAPWANRQPVPENDFPSETDPLDIETSDSAAREPSEEEDATVLVKDDQTTDGDAVDEAAEPRDIIGEIIAEFQIDDTEACTPNEDDGDDGDDEEAIFDLSESDVVPNNTNPDIESEDVSAREDGEDATDTGGSDDAISAIAEMALTDEPEDESDVSHESAEDEILELSLQDLINLPPAIDRTPPADGYEEDAYQLPFDFGMPDEGEEKADAVLDSETDGDQPDVTISGSSQATEKTAEPDGDGIDDDTGEIATEPAPEPGSSASETLIDASDNSTVVQWSRLVGRRRAREIPKPAAVQSGDEKDAVSD